MHFPNEVWKHIFIFVPDYVKQNQKKLKDEVIEEINDIANDYDEWKYFQDDVDFVYYISWLKHTCPYEFDFSINLIEGT